jgi:hypothetical protein
MTIITDTREQKPLKFADDIENEVAGLKTGDYSIKGYEDRFCVEHKTIKDLIGTCSAIKAKGAKHSNRERFRLELQRMKDSFDFYCIVISGNESDILPTCQELYKTQYRQWVTRCNIARAKGYKPPRQPQRPECRVPGVIGSLRAFRADFNCHYYYLGDKQKAAAWIAEQASAFTRHKNN